VTYVYDDVSHVYDDVSHVYDDVTYVFDDVTYVYDDVSHVYNENDEHDDRLMSSLRMLLLFIAVYQCCCYL